MITGNRKQYHKNNKIMKNGPVISVFCRHMQSSRVLNSLAQRSASYSGLYLRNYGLLGGPSGKPNEGIYDQAGHPPAAKVICSAFGCEKKYCDLSPCDVSIAERIIGNFTNKLPKLPGNVTFDNGDGTFLTLNPHSQEVSVESGTVIFDPTNTRKICLKSEEVLDTTRLE